jgi:hypothetical protein
MRWQLVWVAIGVVCLDVLYGAMKYMPAHSFLDEFREVAFLRALRPQKCP